MNNYLLEAEAWFRNCSHSHIILSVKAHSLAGAKDKVREFLKNEYGTPSEFTAHDYKIGDVEPWHGEIEDEVWVISDEY